MTKDLKHGGHRGHGEEGVAPPAQESPSVSSVVYFRRYEPDDAAKIGVAGEGKIPPAIDAMAQQSWAFTGLIDGTVVGCGGLTRLEPHRGIVWALFAPEIPPRAWVAIRDKCELHLRLAELDGIHCIEAEVALRFLPGHRFARMLGFRFVGILPGRAADGGLFVRYARTTAAAEQPPTRVAALLALTDRTLADSLERAAA